MRMSGWGATAPLSLLWYDRRMNAKDIIYYGDYDLKQAFAGLSKKGWQRVGVTTRW